MKPPSTSGSGLASAALGSIGTAASRWLTKRAPTRTSAPSSASAPGGPAAARLPPSNSWGASSSSALVMSTSTGQVVGVDVDHRGGVDGLRAGLGDHDRDRLADEAHLALGQDGAAHLLRGVHGRPGGAERLELQVGRGVDADDARHPRRLLGLDLVDRAVGRRGAHEDGVQRTRLPQVVRVRPCPAQERRVLDPPHRGPVAFTRSVRSRHLRPPLRLALQPRDAER